MKTLETEHFIMREWKLSDAVDLYEYASTDKVGPMAGWKPHDNLEESEKIIKMFQADGDSWALELKENHKVIGSVGLHRDTRKNFEVDLELGYVLAEDYWGQGLIPEAAERAIRFAFEELLIETLAVAHFDFNFQSKRVIEKLGFHHLTHLKDSCVRYDGVILSEEMYIMTKEDWNKQK